MEAARREFFEGTGFVASGSFLKLGDLKQTAGKIITAWAFEGDCDVAPRAPAGKSKCLKSTGAAGTPSSRRDRDC